MQYSIKNENQLCTRAGLIKNMVDEEIPAAEIFTKILSDYYLEEEVAAGFNLFKPSEWTTPDDEDTNTINKLFIPLLLLENNYTINNVFNNNKLDEIYAKMLKNELYVFQDDADLENNIIKIMEIPNNIVPYFDFHRLLDEMNIKRDIVAYRLLNKNTGNSITNFIIENHSMEDYFRKLRI